jgi:chromosome partitioning protein
MSKMIKPDVHGTANTCFKNACICLICKNVKSKLISDYVNNMDFRMKTKYISSLQLKGGVGKSTLATNLVGYFISKKKKVLGIDADMKQGTMFAWSKMFSHENYKSVGVRNIDELLEVLRDANGVYDIVITDLPPRIEELASSALLFSDLVLLPVPISAPDVWAASDLEKLITAAKQEGDVTLRVVWNKFKTTKRNVEMKDEVKDLLGHEEIKQVISDYIAYRYVIGIGSWVGEYTHQKAKAEFLEFCKEVEKLIK